jgi:hypothetical protein
VGRGVAGLSKPIPFGIGVEGLLSRRRDGKRLEALEARR